MQTQRLNGALLVGLALLLGACGREPEPSLNGHWRAEQLQVQSLLLPIGPDLMISERELFVPATQTRLPVQAVERHGRDVTLQFPVGIGWTFRLENDQRMAIDVPLLGLIHYRRVSESVAGSAALPTPAQSARADQAPAAPPAAAAAAAVRSAGETTPAAAQPQPAVATPANPTGTAAASTLRTEALAATPAPPVTGRTDDQDPLAPALRAIAQGDADQALRALDAALRQGRIDAGALRDDPRWAGLRGDLRFQALMARHN